MDRFKLHVSKGRLLSDIEIDEKRQIAEQMGNAIQAPEGTVGSLHQIKHLCPQLFNKAPRQKMASVGRKS